MADRDRVNNVSRCHSYAEFVIASNTPLPHKSVRPIARNNMTDIQFRYPVPY